VTSTLSTAAPAPAAAPAVGEALPVWEPGAAGVPPDVETASEEYARRFAGPVGDWLLAVQTRLVRELLRDLPAGASVLDVGGAHAQLARPLAAAGFTVTVTGSDPRCEQLLRRRLGALPHRFVHAAPLPLPFPDRAFDAVVAVRLLAHVRPWEELLAELGRVARRVVVVDYVDRRSANLLAAPLLSWKRRLEPDTREFLSLGSRQLAAAARRCGLRAVAWRRELVLPLALHRAARQPGLSAALEAGLRGCGVTGFFGSPVLVRLEPAGAGPARGKR
jgi:SAM-dependent methyltransferase